MPPAALLYIHGFLSSPGSAKARQLVDYLRLAQSGVHVSVPQISPYPQAALAQLEAAIAALPRPLGLIGSSLGGYYAAFLAEKHGLPAVLVNPLAQGRSLLPQYVGEHRNPYTGDTFCLDDRHVQELLALEVRHFSDPSRLLLMSQRGDETLPWQDAVRAWPQLPRVLVDGGDHGFLGFEAWLPFVLEFFAHTLRTPSIRNPA